MRKFGLIGKHLSHSFSPTYFSQKFRMLSIDDASYKAFELEYIEQLQTLITEDVVGLNVTIPFKEAVIPYLDELDETALEVMAVNTIKNENGILTGYNTDTYGFQKSLIEFLNDHRPTSALVFGSGGASKAVRFVLQSMDIPFSLVSRSGPVRYEDLTDKQIHQSTLLINTTPVGMYPNEENCLDIPFGEISENHFVFDLIYNPEKTLFLKRAEAQGATISNGYQMLVFQAEKSWEIWNQ